MRSKPLWGLRKRREAAGMTQAQIGAIIGVNQSHYRQFESGGVRLDITRAKALASWLECKIEDLF